MARRPDGTRRLRFITDSDFSLIRRDMNTRAVRYVKSGCQLFGRGGLTHFTSSLVSIVPRSPGGARHRGCVIELDDQ